MGTVSGMQPPDPSGRILAFDVGPVQDGVQRFDVRFKYTDMRGARTSAAGKVFVPEDHVGPVPLVHHAGYEVDDNVAVSAAAAKRCAVASTIMPEDAWPSAHPIARGLNLDIAFLHITRSLPVVDNARVIVQGLSAGGRAALMLAAETFPLLGVMADVPPVNWAYNAAYWRNTHGLPRGPLPDGFEPDGPWLFASDPVTEVFDVAVESIGADVDAPFWYELSPIAHIDRITCPVSILASSSDMLVPVDQFSRDVVRAADATQFPPGFVTDPDELCKSADMRRRLVDVVPTSEIDVVVQPVPADAVRLDYLNLSANRVPTPIAVCDSKRRWTLTVIDEGAPEPRMGHFKHALWPSRDALVETWLRGSVSSAQLSPAKLDMLLSRYAGREWLTPAYTHLDDPLAEQSDVLRSLRTYAALPGGAECLVRLYEVLPPDRRVFGDLMKVLA